LFGLYYLRVSLCIKFLDTEGYGIWLTISSFLSWFTFFEIGLGSGLRNKLAEALALDNKVLARKYVSTTYLLLTIIIGAFALIFAYTTNFVDWTRVLNVAPERRGELTHVINIVFYVFFASFVLRLISTIFLAIQKSALSSWLTTSGNILALFLIVLLTKFSSNSSLTNFALVFSLAPLFIMVVYSLYYFSTKLKHIAPSVHYIDFSLSKSLFGTGLSFFVIQISWIVLFQSSNIIIAQFYGPSDVTTYNIVFKLFGVMQMGFNIIVTPYWSAFTEAWHKNDIEWIKKSIRNLNYIWIGVTLLGLIILIFATPIYHFWVGSTINIPFTISLWAFIYFTVFNFGSIYVNFVNGIGKLKLQLISSLFGMIIFIPLSILFCKYLKTGIEGVFIATILSNFYGVFLAPWHYNRIIGKFHYEQH